MDATKARETVRALEAKALSTTFEGERDAFLAKADSLREKYGLPKRPDPNKVSDAQRLKDLMAEAAAQVQNFRVASRYRTPPKTGRTRTTCGWCGRTSHNTGGHTAWERARSARYGSDYSQGYGTYNRKARASSTHCKHGHDWATNATTDSRGSRVCKACKREASRRAAEKKARKTWDY